MSNLFSSLRENELFSKTNLAIIVWLASLSMFLIGVNHFAEDTYSSYMGIKMLESDLGLIPATWPLTYYTMSISMQIAQIVFAYFAIIDKDKNRKMWLLLAGGALIVDFFADIWYRSDERIFSDWKVFISAFIVTLVWFTIGSEFFITMGFGAVTTMFKPFVFRTGILIKEFVETIREVKGIYRGNSPHPQQQQPQNRSNGNSNEFIDCKLCNAKVKKGNFRSHLDSVHGAGKGGNPDPAKFRAKLPKSKSLRKP